MSIEAAYKITQLAMQFEMQRSEIAASRIALANVPVTDAAKSTLLNTEHFHQLLQQAELSPNDVRGEFRIHAPAQTKQVYEPGNPDADSAGYVTYLDVDVAHEFIVLNMAKRAYEANIRVFNNIGRMSAKSLEIGK